MLDASFNSFSPLTVVGIDLKSLPSQIQLYRHVDPTDGFTTVKGNKYA